MDISALPEEMLREIFSILPFKDLLRCSLICLQWHRIAEPLIYRRACIRIGLDMVGHGQTLWDSARQYHTVIVDNPPCSRRSLVNLLMLPCMVIFKPREVQLRNFVEESLHKFCRHGHRLFEKADTVCVELNDARHNCSHEDVEEFIFSFPTVKHLVWDQYSLANGRNTMVIDAPLLQSTVIDDSVNANTSILHVIGCDQLQQVKCTLRSKRFEDIFCSSFRCLHTLSLDIRYHDCNISLPKDLPSLKWLELSFNEDLTSSVFESIVNYSQLIGLKIALPKYHEPQQKINLNHLFHSLPDLQSIEMSGLNLDVYNTIEAHHMEILKLKHITLANPVLSFNAPKLEVLSICEENLINFSFVNNDNRLKKVFVELTNQRWGEVINAHLNPFVQMHDSVDELVLVSSNNSAPCDKSFFEQSPVDVCNLQLHKFDISCDFVENAHRWRYLKVNERLVLNDCCVVCNCKMAQCAKLGNDFQDVPTLLSTAPEVVIRQSRENRSMRTKNVFGSNWINPL